MGRVAMIGQSVQAASKRRKPRARRFYNLTFNPVGKPPDFEIENLPVLRGNAGALHPPKGRRGFPPYPEVPRMVLGKRGKKLASPPTDLELYHSYWLISDRLKLLFETIDPEAFAFLACDVKLRDGSPGPLYWLCDVVRVLQAFDQTTLEELRRNPRYSFLGDTTLGFDEAAIGGAHVFRIPFAVNVPSVEVFCDERLKDACKQAGIKGARFVACFKK
jgi:hypothetical protein